MNSNNEQNLQKKMDALDTLSAGFVFDKDGAWDKLQTKLETKPKRRILPVYWMSAAACLVVMILMFNIRGRREEHTAAVTPVIAIQPHKDTKVQVATVATRQSDTVAIVPSTYSAKKSVFTKKEEVAAAQQKDIPLIKEEVQQPVTPIADSHPQRMAVVKKKWKVVHINELGNIQEEEVAEEYNKMHREFIAFTIPMLSTNNNAPINSDNEQNTQHNSIRNALTN